MVQSIVVQPGCGRGLRHTGLFSQQRWHGDGVSFGRGLVLALILINQGDLRFRVLNAELRVSHEVMYGATRLGRLQTFVGRDAVSEGVHHPDLRDKREKPVQGKQNAFLFS